MKKKILIAALILIIAIGAFVGWKFYGSAVSTPKGEFFYIPTGSSYDDVKNKLVSQQYITGSGWFDKASGILKYKTVKPGRYKLEKGMSLFELVRLLRAGNQAKQNLVITKLRTRESLASRVGKLFECDSAQMITFLNNNDSLQQYGVDTTTMMAIALPLTYSLNWNSSPSRIVNELHTAYQTFWNSSRKHKADSLRMTPIEVITLASIIDEETNSKTDKPKIASVYLNRIRLGMPLQADPTIKFAMRNFGLRRVLNVHLQTVSPYNTYLNRGLPPGPICTPSAETIDAVLYSPPTEYIYFVANSTFDGTHVFTTDYDDHMKFARIYQKELTGYLKRKDSVARAKQTTN